MFIWLLLIFDQFPDLEGYFSQSLVVYLIFLGEPGGPGAVLLLKLPSVYYSLLLIFIPKFLISLDGFGFFCGSVKMTLVGHLFFLFYSYF